MNKAELDQLLGFLYNAQNPIVKIYAESEGESPKFFDVFEGVDVDFKEMFKKTIKNIFIDKNAYFIKELSTAEKSDDTYYEFNLAQDTTEVRNLKNLINIDPAIKFGADGKKLSDITGLYVHFTTGDNSLSIYKCISNVEKTYAPKGYRFFKSGIDRFKRFNEDLLHITPDFEIIYVGGHVIVTNINKMEKRPEYVTALKKAAKIDCVRIEALGIVSDMAKINALCDKPAYARKLMKAVKDSKVIEKLSNGELSNSDIVSFVKARGDLKIRANRKGTKFYIKGEGSARVFLKILSDDYLTSGLTGTDYDSERKTPL